MQFNATYFVSYKSDPSNIFHRQVKFNNNSIAKFFNQKHFGIVLDSKLSFNSHDGQTIKKCKKLTGVIRKLSNDLPRNVLLTIYESIIRSYLDCDDVLYDKPNNETFQKKI